MTQLGEDMLEWLRNKEGVTMAHDASTKDTGDAIRCCFGGRNWIIALEPGGATDPVPDPRERSHAWD